MEKRTRFGDARGMSLTADWRYGSGGYEQRRVSPAALPQKILPQRVVGGAALACVAAACVWTLAVNLAGPGADSIVADQTVSVGTRGDKLAVARPIGVRPMSR